MKIETTDWMPSRVTVSRPCFAIGDVHGTADRLALLQDHLAQVIRREKLANALFVRLGDYIDRGPESLRVLELARNGLGIADVEERNLMGNHEQFLRLVVSAEHPAGLRFVLNLWSDNGGWAVLREIGYDQMPGCDVEADPVDVQRKLRAALGPKGLRFLENLEISARCGRLLFVHAGIHPRRRLAEFLAMDPMEFGLPEDEQPIWIRGPFLSWTGPFEDDVYVVHGHTPTLNGLPDLHANRLCLDTRAYSGKPLVAAEFRGSELRFHMAESSADHD